MSNCQEESLILPEPDPLFIPSLNTIYRVKKGVFSGCHFANYLA